MKTDPKCGDCECDLEGFELAAILSYQRLTDALIEIAVRNGPRKHPEFNWDWDPVRMVNDTGYAAGFEDEDSTYGVADDYITAARALGIL